MISIPYLFSLDYSCVGFGLQAFDVLWSSHCNCFFTLFLLSVVSACDLYPLSIPAQLFLHWFWASNLQWLVIITISVFLDVWFGYLVWSLTHFGYWLMVMASVLSTLVVLLICVEPVMKGYLRATTSIDLCFIVIVLSLELGNHNHGELVMCYLFGLCLSWLPLALIKFFT